MGEWFFPSDGGGIGTMVPRNRAGGPITRSGFTQQARLNRNTDTLTPTGEYTCMVPDETGTVTASESITLIAGKYTKHAYIASLLYNAITVQPLHPSQSL